MKLDRPGAPRQQPLAPADWSMDIVEDTGQHIAIVARKGVPLCRLSTAAPGLSAHEIRTHLAERARKWIAEYLAREPKPGGEDRAA